MIGSSHRGKQKRYSIPGDELVGGNSIGQTGRGGSDTDQPQIY